MIIEIDSFASWEQGSKKYRAVLPDFIRWFSSDGILKSYLCFCQSFDNQTGITVVTSSEILLASILRSRGFIWTYLVMRAERSQGVGGDPIMPRVSTSWTFAVHHASAHLDRSERTIHSTTIKRKCEKDQHDRRIAVHYTSAAFVWKADYPAATFIFVWWEGEDYAGEYPDALHHNTSWKFFRWWVMALRCLLVVRKPPSSNRRTVLT